VFAEEFLTDSVVVAVKRNGPCAFVDTAIPRTFPTRRAVFVRRS
jgi:hypothetical protein